MRRFLVPCLVSAGLSACHAQDPRRTGLHAAARDVLPASSARLAECLLRTLPRPLRERAASDGSWRQFSDGPPEQASWELRLTRVDAQHTEVEVDASLRDGARGEAMARAAAICAGQ